MIDADALTLAARAAAAWNRVAKRNGGGTPLMSDISVEEHAGKTYVVWRESGLLVGCYRVLNSGKLKALGRVPAGLVTRADCSSAAEPVNGASAEPFGGTHAEPPRGAS